MRLKNQSDTLFSMLGEFLLLLILIFSLLMLITVMMNIFWGAPFVPSNRKTVDLMIKESKFKKGMTVYDLGCGDGRLLIKAEKKYGIKGIGYDNAPLAYISAQINKWINNSKIEIHAKNFFKVSLKDADAIYLYLTPEVQKKLSKKILKECKPGTLIISNTFHLPGVEPLKTIPKNKKNRTKTIHFYKLKKKK